MLLEDDRDIRQLSSYREKTNSKNITFFASYVGILLVVKKNGLICQNYVSSN